MISPGRAIIFLKLDEKKNYYLTRGSRAVYAIDGDKMWWSNGGDLNVLEQIPVSKVIADIQKLSF